jgi:hypothetical protein
MITVQALTDLGIPHKSTHAPGHGILCVFQTTMQAQHAASLLTLSGHTVTPAGPRGLLAVPPPVPTFRQRHPLFARRAWLILIIVFTPSYIGAVYWGYRLVRFVAKRYTLTRRPVAPARRGWVL